MPKSVPLRAIATTIVEPSMSRAASSASLHAGIARLRKKWSLPPMKRSDSATSAASRPLPTIAGARSRSSMRVPARLRLWASSPIWSIWVRIPVTSTGPVCRTARCSSGPSTSRIQRSRVSTSGPYAPYRRTLPSPSFSEQWVRRPVSGSSSTNIHIDGVTTPAIGPTAPWWWQGSSATPVPASKRATASSGSSTMPSSAAPPISAPRSGPEARAHSIGGPACRNWPRSQPEHLGRGRHVDQPGRDAEHRGQRPRVRVPAQRVGGDGGQVGRGAGHRRAPVDPGDRDGLGVDGVGEEVGAGADHVRGSGRRGHRAPPSSSTARRVARALDRWTSAPAPTRARTCCSSPCGS